MVSTHSRPKAAGFVHNSCLQFGSGFNTQPPEGGWQRAACAWYVDTVFQHTAARRRLDCFADFIIQMIRVSTHSRPKAAGRRMRFRTHRCRRFNTQPPEGGWVKEHFFRILRCCFNTQPPEGGWKQPQMLSAKLKVSTHSRPKAAGTARYLHDLRLPVSTHSRPKAAGNTADRATQAAKVSTHSRPKAAGRATTQCPAIAKFQHTAARRRLETQSIHATRDSSVSTHSRPKAAGIQYASAITSSKVSTHSRPKAAGFKCGVIKPPVWFQHTAARRRLDHPPNRGYTTLKFQHTAARRRLGMASWSWLISMLFQHTAARRRLEKQPLQ